MSITDTNVAATAAGRRANATRSKTPSHRASRKVKRASASRKSTIAPITPAVKGKPTTNASRDRKGTKLALLIEMLRRADGASLDELIVALGWQVHSIRGAISGALKKKLALTVETSKVESRGRVYRIAD